MEKSVARRTEELRVKLAPALSAEFSAIAQGRGVLPATLAALALGEYVEKYRRDQQLVRLVASIRLSACPMQCPPVPSKRPWRRCSVILRCWVLFYPYWNPEASARAGAGQVPDRRPQPARGMCPAGTRPRGGPGEDRHLMRARSQYAPGSG